MKRMIKYGSIGQYRNIVKSIQMQARYIGTSADGEALYDSSLISPMLNAVASEKIHGTNGSVCYSNDDGFWVQSKSNIITPEKDNAGCAFTAYNNKKQWMNVIFALASFHNIDLDKNIISVYFEWAGGNIQKNSACSGMTKKAIIFQHFKVSPLEQSIQDDPDAEREDSYWLETVADEGFVSNPDVEIYNIMDFDVFTFPLDFDSPAMSQNQMNGIVELIEKNSPLGKALGIDGNIGEGIVVTVSYKGKVFKFKVKGEKHSKSKVKKLPVVDEAKEREKIDFANYACSPSRLEQAWQETFGINNEKNVPDIRFTGDFLRNIIKDVMKEEMDILGEKGLEPKDVNSLISKISRQWFMSELNKEAGIK